MKLYAAAFLVTLSGTCALAQKAKPPASQNVQPVQIRTQADLVMVPTLVKTNAGELVYTLTSQDFSISDNGIEQRVTLTDGASQQPLALVVVVQTGGTGAQQLPNLRHLETMIEAMVGNVPHHVALVTFDSKPHLQQGFTPDLADLGRAIQAMRPGDNGAAILDGLAVSINMVRKQPPEFRRAVLLISGTVDHGSQTKLSEALRVVSETNTVIYSMAFSTSKTAVKAALANTPSSPSSNKTNNATAAVTPNATEQANLANTPSTPSSDPSAADYSLAFTSLQAAVGTDLASTPSSPSAKGCAQHATQTVSGRLGEQESCASFMPIILFAARLGMNGLARNTPETVARLTGGEYKKFDNRQNLESGLYVFANDLPNRYILSFQPLSPTPGLHTIEVTLKNYPKLRVSARTSYWAASEKKAAREAP
ncbi:MAG: VWA domain-containing protein [Acidobacteriaceae bacterium]